MVQCLKKIIHFDLSVFDIIQLIIANHVKLLVSIHFVSISFQDSNYLFFICFNTFQDTDSIDLFENQLDSQKALFAQAQQSRHCKRYRQSHQQFSTLALCSPCQVHYIVYCKRTSRKLRVAHFKISSISPIFFQKKIFLYKWMKLWSQLSY